MIIIILIIIIINILSFDLRPFHINMVKGALHSMSKERC